ncbi:ABC transporter permease [Aquisalinus luteolus]|uniref:Iron(III) ABC transporter permease n=1 Tax=Aquisalinus luteolus TaxID=1566827 RepID=A0A8J3EQ91_9PROT|nr:iron ABC transporter permease [Aquisalinus luteolus]GGH94491.1 iron(III) ABC transporter permease [Aquisalinus luteolus]
MSPARLAGHAPAFLVMGLVAVPLVTVLAALFVGDTSGTWRHLFQTVLPGYVTNSLLLMVMVGLLSSLIGISTAWLVAATDFPGRKMLGWLLVLPLAAPAYIIAYTYTDLLAPYGPVQTWLYGLPGVFGSLTMPSIRTLPGAALLLSLVLYPYIYLLARASFASRAGTLFEAARILGDSPARAFWRIALPAARPAIAGGLALVLMETLADFGVVEYFSVPTLSTGIYRTWIGMGEKLAAMKIAGVMLLFVLALISFESLTRGGRTDTSRGGRPARLMLSPVHQLLAIATCALPVLFGFLLPAIVLAGYTIESGDSRIGDFLTYATNSISISCIAAILAAGLALMLAYAQRLSGNWATNAAIRFATMGYALPGILIAIGILGSLAGFDRTLTGFASAVFGYNGGLILSGTIILLTYAYVIRFLTVSFNSVNAGLAAIAPNMDDAARSLGASPRAVIRRIHAPMMVRSLGAALLLVFVDSMRELPATLVLRPFNFETLATRVYRLASDERLMEASTSALAIILIGIVPVLLLSHIGSAEETTPRS